MGDQTQRKPYHPAVLCVKVERLGWCACQGLHFLGKTVICVWTKVGIQVVGMGFGCGLHVLCEETGGHCQFLLAYRLRICKHTWESRAGVLSPTQPT